MISKPKGSWRSLSQDTAGPSNHGKMCPWKSPTQQFPRCSSGFQHKIALQAENIHSEEIFPHNRKKLLSQVQNQREIFQWCPCPSLDRLEKTSPHLQVEAHLATPGFHHALELQPFPPQLNPNSSTAKPPKKLLFVHLTKIPSLHHHFVHVGWERDTAKRFYWKFPWTSIQLIRN